METKHKLMIAAGVVSILVVICVVIWYFYVHKETTTKPVSFNNRDWANNTNNGSTGNGSNTTTTTTNAATTSGASATTNPSSTQVVPVKCTYPYPKNVLLDKAYHDKVKPIGNFILGKTYVDDPLTAFNECSKDTSCVTVLVRTPSEQKSKYWSSSEYILAKKRQFFDVGYTTGVLLNNERYDGKPCIL